MPDTPEKTSYSPAELEEFRAIIDAKLADAREEFAGLQESLRNSNEISADGYNMTEFGTEMHDREQTEMLLSRTGKFIDALERALIRINNGTYGRCKVTGTLIPKERLRVVPHTETSIEAKLQQKTTPVHTEPTPDPFLYPEE